MKDRQAQLIAGVEQASAKLRDMQPQMQMSSYGVEVMASFARIGLLLYGARFYESEGKNEHCLEAKSRLEEEIDYVKGQIDDSVGVKYTDVYLGLFMCYAGERSDEARGAVQ